MNGCTDFWCEYYGKAGESCGQCDKKGNVKDKPDLRVILKRREVNQMELEKNTGKRQAHEQSR
jgi:hypothetical protein